MGIATIQLAQFMRNTDLTKFACDVIKRGGGGSIGKLSLFIDVFKEQFQETGFNSDDEFTNSKSKKKLTLKKGVSKAMKNIKFN